MLARRTAGAVQGYLSSRLVLVCVGITIVLATSAAGFAQSTSPDAPRLGILQRMAMRELQGIAYSAANILNVYMDARVTDMLVCCSTMDALKDALVKP